MLTRILVTGMAASCTAVLSVPLFLAPVLADDAGTPAVALATPASARVDYGTSITETTTLTDVATTLPLTGASVRLLSKVTGKPFTEVATAVTDDLGVASVTLTPEVNTTYEWVYDGDAEHAEGASGRSVVKVAVLVEGAVRKVHVKPGHRTRVFGVLHPALPGTTVVLEQQAAGSWHRVASTVVASRLMPDGTRQVGYLMRFRTPGNGSFNLRVAVPVIPFLAKATPLRLQVTAY